MGVDLQSGLAEAAPTMSGCTNKYVSMFRLDGKPILPPLMTAEKRQKMQQYRDQAIRLEQQQKQRNMQENEQQQYTEYTTKNEINSSTDYMEQYGCEATRKAVEESYLLLATLVLNDSVCAESANISADILTRVKKLQKTDTIIYDNRNNAVIVPMESEAQVWSNREQHATIPAINIDPPTPLGTRSFCDVLDISDDLDSLEELQMSSEFSAFSNVCTSTSLTLTPPKRSATIPAINLLSNVKNKSPPSDTATEETQRSLTRSNSFTLKTPSKALIEHMRQQRLQQKSDTKNQKINSCKKEESLTKPTPYVARDTIESKAKRVQKVELNDRASKSNVTDYKNKRSPYEQRLGTKAKLSRNLKKTVLSPAINKSPMVNYVASTPRSVPAQRKLNTVTNDGNAVQRETVLINDAQAEHRQKLMQLLAEQQQAHERMQEAFALQRNQLLQELASSITIDENNTILNEDLCYNNNNSPKSNESSQKKSSPKNLSRSPTNTKLNEYSARSSRRQLFADNSNNHSACSSPMNSTGKLSTFSFDHRKHSIAVDENEIRQQAATKINACARGYLVRRLYRTEQVQRIVETIKDTLYFVISLHYETKENPVEANSLTNKELKTRLLQQLLAATKALHMIFFETSLKERLDIIARDRKRIKMKRISKGSSGAKRK